MEDNVLGVSVDELFALGAKKEELNNELKGVNEKIDSLEYSIICQMEELGLEQAKTDRGTVSKKIVLYPNIKDKEAFLKWCVKKGDTTMLIARANASPFNAYFAETNEYPDGIDAYEKSTLNVRKAR